MNDILPGGYPPHHRFLPEKEGWYSQLLLKRCVEDRNPLLPIMEDKYKSRELVESRNASRLPKLYHWAEMDASIPWDDLPERCVIKTNHWSGDTLFLIDNAAVPLANVERKLRVFGKGENRYKIIRNGRDQNGAFWPRWRIERKLQRCLKKDFPVPLEWGAYAITPRGVMIEELLTVDNAVPEDWKVHVFHGKAGFIQNDRGRMGVHAQGIYDVEGVRIQQSNAMWSQEGMPDEIHSLLGVEVLRDLVETAERLAGDIDYTRVDFYLCGSEWVFGEYTNYHNSCAPQSDEWEKLGGSLWLQTQP